MATKVPFLRRDAHLRAGHRRLIGLLRSEHGAPDAFGSERSFSPPIGEHWEPGGPIHGTYIDFRLKTETPEWPPAWLPPVSEQLHVGTAQWGLGAYERFVCDEGDTWLAAACAAGEHLVETQQRGGRLDGAWPHLFPMPHTYRLEKPWLSAIAQGESASLLVRLFRQTEDERFADAARRALKPMLVPVSEGGTFTELDGAPFVEEYPTDPSSYVLNGAIFSLWGFYDVGIGLGDPDARHQFDTLTAALAANLHRWDTGYWSRYDLYPHPVANVASPAYHLLHIRQLEVLGRLAPNQRITATRECFERYRESPASRRRALAKKVAFRLVVPRNAALANRLPWSARPANRARKGGGEVLVLSYHAVSEHWDAALSVTPEQLESQLDYLADRGFRAITFAEAATGEGSGKRVAITFDDGYRSVLETAKPILDARGMIATLFVPTDFIGSEKPMHWPGIERWRDGKHAKELMPLSWEEVSSLVAGGWEIGSHTCSHPQLTQLDDIRLGEELAKSRRECEERLGVPCKTVAFPYGDVDRRVAQATEQAGYSAGAALAVEGRCRTPYQWPRVGVYHVDDERSFRLKVSRPVRILQRSRAWKALGYALRVVRPHDPLVD